VDDSRRRLLLEGLGAATELWAVTRAIEDTVHFVDVSAELAVLLGYPLATLLERPWADFLYPPERARLVGVSQSVRVDGNPLVKTLVRYQRSDGRVVHLDFHSRRGGEHVFSVVRDMTAAVLSRAQARLAMASLREIASRDAMTGLYNRRLFDELLQRELQRALRTHRPVSLVSLDVDHFKRLNDVHGHDVGDLALKAVADCIRASVRADDLAFRVGGEELAIVLPECSGLDAAVVAQRVLDAVRRCEVLPGVRMTVSAGCVTFPDHGVTSGTLAKSADVALYAAKQGGRDRVFAPG
jgi:diguanylate cyclase (GGDEF)-like protein/PAS domain S-box-containing protein